MQKIALIGGKIFDGEKFAETNLLVQDGKIVAMGEIERHNAIEIDCKGCIISSGLVDIHTHLLEMGNMDFGFPADMATIPFGVMYAVDVCAVRSNEEILKKLCVETKVFIPVDIIGETLDYERIEKRISLYGDRAIGIKVFFDKSQYPSITANHLRLACAVAREKGLLVMVHSTGSPIPMAEIVEILSPGDILSHVYHGGEYTVEENDYKAYKLAKEKGIVLDVGMAGGVHTDFEVLRKAIECGYIPDTISTDITKASAYMRGGIYGLPMCMSIMKAFGMHEEKVFQAVTKNAATAVGQEGWFDFKVGSGATMSVMKYDSVEIDMIDRAGNRISIQQGYTCKLTIKNGQIIYRKEI